MCHEKKSHKNGKTKRNKLRRLIKRIVLDVLIIYAAGLLAGFIFQKHFIYFPSYIDPSEKIPLAPGDEEVWIEVPDVGKIHGVYHKAPPEGSFHSTSTSTSTTVLFFHGNADNILRYTGIRDGLVALGMGVLMIDYPGFGKSEGSPSEEALYASAHAAVRFLESLGVEKNGIVIFGKSLGSAVAVELAASDRFAGVVLESPFTSLASVGQSHYWFLPVSPLLRERYDSLSRIGQVGCPLLMIVGTEDTLVPPAQSLELFDSAREPKELLKVEGAGHNDIQSVGGRGYWNKLRDWMERIRVERK